MSSPRLCQLDAGRRRGHQDSDSTESVYGRDVTFKAVVQGKVATPEIAREFMKAVRETAHKTKVQEARDGEK